MRQPSPVLPHTLLGPVLHPTCSKYSTLTGHAICPLLPDCTGSLTMAALFPQFPLPGTPPPPPWCPLCFPDIHLSQHRDLLWHLLRVCLTLLRTSEVVVILVFPASNTVEGLFNIRWINNWRPIPREAGHVIHSSPSAHRAPWCATCKPDRDKSPGRGTSPLSSYLWRSVSYTWALGQTSFEVVWWISAKFSARCCDLFLMFKFCFLEKLKGTLAVS